MLQHVRQRGLVVFAIIALSLSFQNCETNQSRDIAATENKSAGTDSGACSVPWHSSLQVLNGKSVTAYQTDKVADGGTCVSETRSCTDGTLSGSFAFGACVVEPATSVDCAVPWDAGLVVKDGSSVKAYRLNADGSACDEETRACAAGTLSGSFELAFCPAVGDADCRLPNGETLKNGTMVKLKEDGSPFTDTDCGDYTQYTCADDTLTVEVKTLKCEAKSCVLPWGGELAHGKSVNAYKSAEAKTQDGCRGDNVEKRTCQDGELSGSFKNKSCQVVAEELKVCRVEFKSGGAISSKVKNEAACYAYYEVVKKNNPNQKIVKLTLDGKVLKIPVDEVKGTYVAYKIKDGKKSKLESKSQVTLAEARIACRAQIVKDESAGYECTFNGLVFQKVDEPKPALKLCQVNFKSGASASTKVENRAKCEAYWAEIKKNNPKQEIRSVIFDGQVIYMNTSDLGILTVTITKDGKVENLGVADITKSSALKMCDDIIAKNPDAGVTCKFNGAIIREVKPTPTLKVCQVNFKSGGSISSKVASRAKCEDYWAEVKKNNPQQEIRSVTFDGQVIYMNTSDLGTLTITITKDGASRGMGIADISKDAAIKRCDDVIKDNKGAGVKCLFNGKLFREVFEASELKVCKVTFTSGGSISSKVASKAKCRDYAAEVKKNNPGRAVKSVTFDGQSL